MSTTHQKRSRLSRAEIAEILKHGSRAHGALSSCVWMRRTPPYRAVSVVVSKKVSRTAVGRNRVKRRLRAAYWSLPTQSPSPAPCVIISKSAAQHASSVELRKELASLLVRAV